jgi:hypothetical protein
LRFRAELFLKKSGRRYAKLRSYAADRQNLTYKGMPFMTLPEPFGWRTSWLAVRTTGNELLAPELQLVNLRSCDWEEGLREANEKGIFICPPVAGWTLIVGGTLPDTSAEETLPLIVRLSENYGSAQYFGNHRVVDYYAWAKAERGRLIRAYAFLGEKGVTPWDRGELTKEEMDLGMVFDEPLSGAENPTNPHESLLEMLQRLKQNPSKHPKEEDVFAIARKWSVDPTQIEEYEISESQGVLGYREAPVVDRR